MNREMHEMRDEFARRGLPMMDRYDTAQMLGVIREQRRRTAPEDKHQAAATLAATVLAQMRQDVHITDWRQAADVLLAASGYLAVFAASDVPAAAITNILAFMGDDIAKEQGL